TESHAATHRHGPDIAPEPAVSLCLGKAIGPTLFALDALDLLVLGGAEVVGQLHAARSAMIALYFAQSLRCFSERPSRSRNMAHLAQPTPSAVGGISMSRMRLPGSSFALHSS